MAIGKKNIYDYLSKKDINDRLIVTPLLEKYQVGESSIDLRLGNEFIVTRRGNQLSIDPGKQNDLHGRYQAKHNINYNDKFYLHPSELVLAGSLEYIKLPRMLSGYVTSRSKWGRSGLVIATAIAVAPGFRGCITLELVNLGEVPLVLYPGLRIAQLVLEECVGGEEYCGSLSCFTGPLMGDVTSDKDTKYFVADEGATHF